MNIKKPNLREQAVNENEGGRKSVKLLQQQRREYYRHGLYYCQRLLSGDGLKKSTGLYHALREKEEELIAALGGDPSPQERALIADSVKNILYIGSLDNYLMGLKTLVRKSRPHPVLAIRTQLAAHLRENLKTIGLHRRIKTKSLQEILDESTDEKGDSDER